MIKTITVVLLRTILFALLTLFTQIGGIIYLISFVGDYYIDRFSLTWFYQLPAKLGAFLVLYLIIVSVIVPPLAFTLSGRVPLPLSGDLEPLNKLTWFFNRQYVKPELKEMLLNSAAEMKQRYPEVSVRYLDANFPFIDKFPLPPHLSHNDGKKVDIAFFYKSNNGSYLADAPSLIGYGVYEGPRDSESNLPEVCARKGYWQYSLIGKIVSQKKKPDYLFDEDKVSAFVKILCDQKLAQKVFIEPHLKERLNLTSPKIRFHGCQAVRHDDHIHLQIN